VVTVRTAVQAGTRGDGPPRGTESASTRRGATAEPPAPPAAPPGAAGAAARHTTAAEQLAAEGRWEQAYQHLRAAVRLLQGHPTAGELDRLRREHAEAREQSRRDSLTASYNRRYLDERLAALLDDPACRGTAGASVALVDADHFKQVNDTYGHLFGDRVLQRIVTELDAGLPDGAFCEAARHRIDRHPWTELDADLRVTVSIGVAHTAGPVTAIERLVGAADGLLYAAKHSGRNAVAYRDDRTGAVRLAGPAAGRRSILQAPRVAVPGCDRNGSPP
jgi:GGDEF domain-containing protein